jgi:3-methylcrotonyl-CoA carboxylase alpha subunit
MMKSVLIANRGEIACRVIRTARRLGIRAIAVYSDADASALHVRMADEALRIGPGPARESYLRGDKIIEAAKSTGAEAVHPGYGFLSENADFAQDVIDAGLIWVGPKPESIRSMGLKDAAKRLMANAGVPVTPGYLGEDQDPKRLRKEASAVGYPVLIKAVAGGGGKGMRRVDAPDEFDDALDSAKREAAGAFGDDRVLIEKYILSPRHIEVQVFGDSQGNVVHLFERDCSLQRRHQKVIEEAPAPGMDAKTREAVCNAAVRAAQAVNYENAGTIEFIADASKGLKPDRIWFMEMNTRLQVEHPVTEEITGQDLVEWQLRVASGEPLPRKQDELAINGHAIEARLYAEDPAKSFLPSVGRIETMLGCICDRFETGVEAGSAVSPFYDPMIAKMISTGAIRNEAICALIDACESVYISPIKTNAWFLGRLLRQPEFADGNFTTSFIGEHLDELTQAPIPSQQLLAAAASLLVRRQAGEREGKHRGPTGLNAFRLNAPRQDEVEFLVNGAPVQAALDDRRAGDYFGGDNLWWFDGATNFLAEDGAVFAVRPIERRGTGTSHGVHDGEIEAPMPGKITAIEVSNGEKVSKGQRLLTLEAMKMEHALTAPFDGTITELSASTGAQVTEGQLLVKVEAEPTDA